MEEQRLVDLNRALEIFGQKNRETCNGKLSCLQVIRILCELPAVRREKARWIRKGNETTCSNCGFIYYSNKDMWNYCPNCGRGME